MKLNESYAHTNFKIWYKGPGHHGYLHDRDGDFSFDATYSSVEGAEEDIKKMPFWDVSQKDDKGYSIFRRRTLEEKNEICEIHQVVTTTIRVR